MKYYLFHILALFMLVSLTACDFDLKSQVQVSQEPESQEPEVIPPYITSIESSAYTNCILTRDGVFKCWGYRGAYNFANGLNDDDENEYISDDPEEKADGIPASQLGDMTVLHAETNEYFGCALYENKSVKCWGNNDYVGLDDPANDTSGYTGDIPEELGNNLPVINFGDGLTVKQLSLGNAHACVILNNDRLKCWGSNDYGQAGLGDTETRGDDANEMGDALSYVDLGTDENQEPYTAKQVMAGYGLTCAVLNNDQIKCWGDNSSAQLGYGDIENRGDDADEMGNNLPFVDLGSQRTVKKVFAYYAHTCAILDNDALKCWGDNSYGQIGLAIASDYVGSPANMMGDNLLEIDFASDAAVVDVLLGDNHTCALLADSTLKCWGYNAYGQAGLDSDETEWGTGIDESPGNRTSPNLGTDESGAALFAVAIAGSYDYSCAVLNNNSVKCWGYDGGYATLGTPEYFDTYIGDGIVAPGVPGTEMGDNLKAIELFSDSE